MILTGERLLLEPLQPADALPLHRLLHDPETMRYMVLGRTAPSAQRWVADLMDGWPRHVAWGVKLRPKADPVMIGRAHLLPFGVVGLWNLDWLARKAEFRIVLKLAPHERGHGLGTEATRLVIAYAFTALNLERIWLGTAAENTAARRCFEKCGFQQEGVLEGDFLGPDGRRTDNVRYGLLKPRWEALNVQK